MKNPNDFRKQKERAYKRKLELIDMLGGKCSKCGYDKNFAALEFHHKNPIEKDFGLNSRMLSNTNVEKLINEANKCILLCANCHREEHNPNMNSNAVVEFTTNSISVLEPKRKILICKYCKQEFNYVKGKKYCSDVCRNLDKNYPSADEIDDKYKELKKWSAVCEYYNLSYKVIKNILM
jgi:hypothetical protein